MIMSGSFPPSLGRQTTTAYSGRGSQHCYEIIVKTEFEFPTFWLKAGECKTLNALFGVAYDREHLKSRPSVGQLLGNLLKRRKAGGSKLHPSLLSPSTETAQRRRPIPIGAK